VTKKYLIIFEDTPQNKLDRILTNVHGESHWGKGHFRSNEEWITTFNRIGLNIIENSEIGRLTFPFSAKPWIYPVPKRMYCLM